MLHEEKTHGTLGLHCILWSHCARLTNVAGTLSEQMSMSFRHRNILVLKILFTTSSENQVLITIKVAGKLCDAHREQDLQGNYRPNTECSNWRTLTAVLPFQHIPHWRRPSLSIRQGCRCQSSKRWTVRGLFRAVEKMNRSYRHSHQRKNLSAHPHRALVRPLQFDRHEGQDPIFKNESPGKLHKLHESGLRISHVKKGHHYYF